MVVDDISTVFFRLHPINIRIVLYTTQQKKVQYSLNNLALCFYEICSNAIGGECQGQK